MKISYARQFVLLVLLGATVSAQSNQNDKSELQPDHGKILWQFDTQG